MIKIKLDKIKQIGEKLVVIPNDFNEHPTIKRIFEAKRKMFQSGKGFDWSRRRYGYWKSSCRNTWEDNYK